MSISSKILQKLLYGLYGLYFITLFASLALVTGCLLAVIPGQMNRRSAARQGGKLLFRLTGTWPDIEGLDYLPAGPSVVVANHASYMDGILLATVLPSRYQFVIKREITSIPGVHWYLRRIGAHFVDRFDVRKGATDARRIIQTATNGGSLAIFPEGTFRLEPGLRRFQNGAFTIAVRNHLPLVPITISGTREMLPAEVWLPKPAQLKVTIHQPYLTDAETDPITARDECRKNICSALNEPDLLNRDNK
jgi:1-acyl-sn-glycerol-3-phosphate acyltransferase